MILIDTNVISELMRPKPASQVLAWFGSKDASALYLSAVGETELRRGAMILPEGRRRDGLLSEIVAMIMEDFAGRPISFPDCQIAATARAHGAAVATRNVADEGCGVKLVDAWTQPGGT